jgi:uncharacterized membrane protein YgcG
MRWLGLLLLALAVPLAASPAAAEEERILSFHSRVQVEPDSSLTVTETIKVRATGDQIERGIYRDFPTYYPDIDGGGYQAGFKVVEVKRNGESIGYFTENHGIVVRVFMGDRAFFIDPGIYTYAFTYKTTRQLRYFAEYDELYWNVTGNDWLFPIDAASATIVLPSGASIIQEAAYTGPAGAQGQDWTAGVDGDGNRTFRATRPLALGEGLTIAVDWPKGLIARPTGMENFLWLLRKYLAFIGPGLGLALISFLYYVKWNRHGRDPKVGTVIPLFTPPDGLAPAAARYVRKMGFDKKGIGAAIVNLAVKGRLEIADGENGEYELNRLADSPDPSLSPGERAMEEALFAEGGKVTIGRKNRVLLQTAMGGLSDSLEEQYKGSHFTRKYGGLGKGLLLSFVTIGIAGFSMANFGILVFGINVGAFTLPGTVIALVAINTMFIIAMKAPTDQGRLLLDGIEGFRMYLGAAEQNRMNMLNPPERTPELFEKWLPYAIALDMENEWGEQFNDVLAMMSADPDKGGYRPSWYRGNFADHSWSSGVAFASGIGGALSSSMSSSTGSSGSGGGGSSGGGGGGGGGGGF